jgi:hypothetical protein
LREQRRKEDKKKEKVFGKGKEGRIEDFAADNNELENDSKGIGRTLIHVLPRSVAGGTDENTESLRISIFQTKI